MEIGLRRVPGTAMPGWLDEHWFGDTVVVHGTVYHAEDVDFLVAESGAARLGALSFVIENEALEVISIDVTVRRQGVGRALVAEAIRLARSEGLHRVWCTTTNDNLGALGFWQSLGFELCALRPGEVTRSRAIKPSIPETGEHGIPIRDELDLQLRLD